MISATYITLQRQIADELGDRQDLLSPLSDSSLTSSPIKNAIQSAIAKWEREPFYFNEYYADSTANPSWSFATQLGKEFYTTSGDVAGTQTGNLLANSPYLIRAHILISGNRYPLNLRPWSYLEDTSANPSVTGNPIDYAYYAETLRLYPIPDGVYPISFSGVPRFTALSADADSNCWTTDAFDLIRSEAKLILAQEVLFDDELATRMKRAIYGDPEAPVMRGYLSGLKTETFRRARAKIIPSYF